NRERVTSGIDKIAAGKDAATWSMAPYRALCRPNGKGGYNLSVRTEVTIHTQYRPGTRDKASAESPGLTLREHEELHASDLKNGCSNAKVNADSRFRTDEFNSLGECLSAADAFGGSFSEYLNELAATSELRRDVRGDIVLP